MQTQPTIIAIDSLKQHLLDSTGRIITAEAYIDVYGVEDFDNAKADAIPVLFDVGAFPPDIETTAELEEGER